jgi:Divergent InlB B-repeat domain
VLGALKSVVTPSGRAARMIRRGLLPGIALVLLIGAATAWAAPPPTLKIEVIGRGKVTGTGISCGNGPLACYASYAGASVDLTETPASGWTFTGWRDDASPVLACTTPAPNCNQVALAGDKTATAVFSLASGGVIPTADYNVALAGAGNVSNGPSTEAPVDCGNPGTACSVTVPVGSVLTVLQTPDATTFFGGWGGACSGTSRACAATVTGSNTSVSANFVAQGTNTLHVTVDSGGSVSGTGITTCHGGSTCDYEEPSTATITLTATNDDGYAFTGWGGACSGLQSTCTVQMSAERSVTANFDLLVTVLVSVTGNGTVTGVGVTCGPGPKTCTGNAPPNTTQLITASPAVAGTGVTFSGCTIVTTTTCKVSVGTSTVGVGVTFSGGAAPPPSFTLSVDVTGNGYVTSSNGQLWCTAAGGAGCSIQLSQNSSVSLSAVAASGLTSDFIDWAGDCDSFTTASCSLTMNGSKSVGAEFQGTDTTFTLSAQTLGAGSGTIGGGGLKCSSTGISGCTSPEPSGATLTLSETASPGSAFTGWGGACTGTGTCHVTMTTDKSVTATFASTAPTSQALTIEVSGAGTVKTSVGTCAGVAKSTKSCVQEYAPGTKVVLTATHAKGQAFFGWVGACKGGANTCTVTLTTSLAVTATFAPPTLASTRPVAKGLRLTVAYKTKESGTLRLSATRSKVTVARSKRLAAPGKGLLPVTVKRHGRYTVTLTLTSKTGIQTLHWVVTL